MTAYLSAAVAYARAAWWWLTERVAVEVVRLRTGWLADAWLYLTDVVRGRGRGTGLHVLPAGEVVLPYERTYLPRLATMSGPPWETSPPLRALPPVPDRLDAMIREFEAEQEVNAVIPPRIAATLARSQADQTVIDTSHATLEPYIIGLAGGDPFDGLGQDAWLDRLFAGAR